MGQTEPMRETPNRQNKFSQVRQVSEILEYSRRQSGEVVLLQVPMSVQGMQRAVQGVALGRLENRTCFPRMVSFKACSGHRGTLNAIYVMTSIRFREPRSNL